MEVLYQLSYIGKNRKEARLVFPCYSTILCRAGDETRTRDIQLGRLMLYQLSYSRLFVFCLGVYANLLAKVGRGGFEPPKT
jgi:hypothetical protein